MDRREFATLLPTLLATTALLSETASAQQPATPANTKAPLPEIVSGVYPPGPATGSGGRTGHRFLAGMLKAGNIQIRCTRLARSLARLTKRSVTTFIMKSGSSVKAFAN